MQALTVHRGIVVPMPADDINTDAILPKQYMKSIERTGFGGHLFDGLRYLDPGEPGIDNRRRRVNPGFVLNHERYRNASILLAGRNFGCGSSREHAPWALAQYGFRVLIAKSFADIFASNCFRNGLLPIALSDEDVEALLEAVAASPGYALTVDLEAQRIHGPGGEAIAFVVDPGQRERLLKGQDEIAATLELRERISRFEMERSVLRPWLRLATRPLPAGVIEGAQPHRGIADAGQQQRDQHHRREREEGA